MQYILCAAIKYDDGEIHPHQPLNVKQGFVVCGRRHHNCIAILSVFGKRNCMYKHTQGFVTNDDLFVDRKQAAIIAFKAKQIKEEKDELFSEDLY